MRLELFQVDSFTNKIFEGNDNKLSGKEKNNVSNMTNKGTDNEDNVVNLITAIEKS